MSSAAHAPLVEPLTGREQEVLELLAQGKSDRQLAGELVLSLHTVKWYNRQIYGKLGVENREAAVARARLLGLVTGAGQERANHYLPLPLSSFIGRHAELSVVRRALGGSRLLTLTGAGGCGKSRLAIQAARGVLADFADGVWLVELARLFDGALVAPAVAEVLDLLESRDRTPLAFLQDYLRDRKLLLILDNCEHLVEAAAELADALLRHCSYLQILATSREPLGVAGEVIWLVPSLSLPEAEAQGALADLEHSDAVRPFVDRAATSLPTFTLTTANAPAVEQVCRTLDGIPLAIELAAARVPMLRVEHIAARLDDRFQFLTGGSRGALPRHQTLAALIDWSYDLLAPAEQRLLTHLSVFAGGFTLEAAGSVCGGDDGGDLLDRLAQLVNKSLVVVRREPGQEARYHLLETIRQYAWSKLRATGEADRLQDRHLTFNLQLAETAEPFLLGSELQFWLDRLEIERDNLRAAIVWADTSGDVETLARLGGALGIYWGIRGYIAEGQRWLSVPLRYRDQLTSATSARLTFALGWLAFEGGDYVAAKQYFLDSHHIMDGTGDTGRVAQLLTMLAHVSQQQGDFAEAELLCQESLALYEALDDTGGIASCLNRLGRLAELQGDYVQATKHFQQSLALRESIGDERGIASTLNALAELARYQGEYKHAARLYAQSLTLCSKLGDKRCLAGLNHNLGHIAVVSGDPAKSTIHFRASLVLYQELENTEGIALCLAGYGVLFRAVGELERAALFLSIAARQLQRYNVVMSVADQAAYESNLVHLRKHLDDEIFWRHWHRGQALAVEEVIALALAFEEPQAAG